MKILPCAIAGFATVIVLLVIITAFICFYMAFYVTEKQKKPKNEFDLPPGKEYEPFADQMIEWIKEVRGMLCTEVSVTSFDGLTLYGKYYEYKKGAPIELMFHGYRGSAERDLCGGVQRSFALGRSVLIVDQRASGKSGGHVISFGINESRDCDVWIKYIIDNIDKNAKIILTGISMGASTVMIAAGKELPENVVGVLADCGYSNAGDMIKKTISEMKLPAKTLYPFVKLGAKLFGKFDLEETTPLERIKKCSVPVIFFHGDADEFVPCEMSKVNHDACNSPKKLVIIEGAGHGASYLVAPELYLTSVADFFSKNGLPTNVVK